jgi:predicted amidophosphoribosyltransferase
MSCKGICIRHKAQKPVGSGRYATGQKRCQQCNIFIKWDELWCPCCGYRLRTRPRHFKHKAQLREQKRIEEAKKIGILYHLQSA